MRRYETCAGRGGRISLGRRPCFLSVVIVGRGVVVSGKGIKRVIIVVLDAASVDVVAAAELVVRG